MEKSVSIKQPNHRLRRWHVAFGNPALGTYNGSIVTAHPRKLEQQHSCVEDGSYTSEDDDSTCSSFSSCSSVNSLIQDYDDGDESKEHMTNRKTNRTAVMTNVPPHQVPDGKIVLLRLICCI